MTEIVIKGAGGGKSGGGGRVAKEDSDSLRSKQYASVVDVISEGEIGGLVDGMKSIYLNETPLQNSDGTLNFKDVSYFSSAGTQTLPSDGDGLQGYFRSGGVRATTAVAVEVKHGSPVTRTISNPEADWAEVTIGIPQLTTQNKENGDIHGGRVTIGIELQTDGAGFLPVTTSKQWVTGHTTPSTGIYRPTVTNVIGLSVFASVTHSGSPPEIGAQYRAVGALSWIDIAKTSTELKRSGYGLIAGSVTVNFVVEGLESDDYEVRLLSSGASPTMDRLDACEVSSFDVIDGKTSSRYQRTYRVPLTGDGPWDVRVTRYTGLAPDSSIQDKTFWDIMTTGIDAKLSYPNTAATMLSMDAESFQSIPTRGYEIFGLLVRVPGNYDPVTRVYTGSWDGTFKKAWTDNPAWCFYDILTNTRYGLGEFMDAAQVDKWGLYQIGKYCDQMVSDGFGGTEPRFTCNLYLQTRDEAFKVITGMASIFRGMAYWAGGQVMASQDAPSEPVALLTAANAIGGMFTYQGADLKARHTVALVSWNDPGDMYRQKIEYVQDDDAVRRWGVVETELLAVGCTSRGQAHRAGKWLLYTEQHESETISFKAGMDQARLAPGAVIAVQDSVRSGKRFGGRLMGSTLHSATLDAPVEIQDGLTYELSVVMPDGTIETRPVLNGPGSRTQLTLGGAELPTEPVDHAIWVLTASNLTPELWRVLVVTEVEPTVVEILGVYHDPAKFTFVENDLILEPTLTSNLPARPSAVTGVTTETQLFASNDMNMSTRIAVHWAAPATASSYLVVWRRDSENWKSQEVQTASCDIDNVAAGEFTIKITARNALGRASETVTVQHTVDASAIAPDIQDLRADPNFTGKDLPLVWTPIPGAVEYEVEVRDPATSALLRSESTPFPQYNYTYTKSIQDGGPRRSVRVGVIAKTLLGTSANQTIGTFSNPAPGAPLGVSVDVGPGQAAIMAQRPDDEDLAGMIVWMHTTAAVPAVADNIVYQGPDNAFVKTDLQAGVPVYFRVAFFDNFGTTGLNTSSSLAATPLASGGITRVTELPANPAAIGGQLALFLDVPDANDRGLYGWDGTQWISTARLLDGSVDSNILADDAVLAKHIVAGAVTAEKMAVEELSAISSNLGTATAGNLTLDAEGFIQGGATAYGSGTGIWMGYSGGAYKFRVGIPGASRLEWNGSAVNIYNEDGQLTMTSGVVDFTRLGNKPTTLGEISPAEAAKLAGMELGATRNVFRGVWTVGMVLLTGETTTYDGSSWTAKVGHTASLTNRPPTLPTTSNLWWDMLASAGATGVAGSSALGVVLSNESHVFPADSTGAVSTYSGSGTDIRVYEGSVLLSYDGVGTANGTWTVTSEATNVTRGTITDTGSYATVGNHSLVGTGIDLAQIVYTITGKTATGLAFTLTKAQSFSKSKSGTSGGAGQNATAYWLARSTASIQRNTAGAYAPSSVIFSSYSATGSAAPAGYAGRFIIATSVDGSVYTNTYTSASDEFSKSYAVPAGIKTLRVRLYLAGGTSTLVDEEVIPVVSDGLNGSDVVTAVLSNDTHAFPASATGAVSSYANSGTTVRLYEGTSELSYDGVGTANGTWRVTAASSNITPGLLTDSGAFLTIGQHSGVASGTDTAAITYTITGKTLAGASFTLVKDQTFSKSKAGTDGLSGTSATAYWLARSAGSVQRSVAGAYTPSSVTFSSFAATGAGAPAGYAGRFIIATSVDGSVYTNTYTSAGDESSKSYVVPAGIKALRARLYMAGGTSTLLDEEIIPVVSDGLNGVDGTSGANGLNFSEAKMLYTDPTFQNGVNGIVAYNNEVGANVGVTRVAKQADSPYSDSGYNLRITTSGAASPGLGGFLHQIQSRASAVFVQRIIAKIPVGYEIALASNAIGDSALQTWTTARAGTGKFEEYIVIRRCGATGSFSTTGHIYITGAAGTAGAPVNWYLAYAGAFDFTAISSGSITAVLSNSTHAVPTDSAGAGGNFTGCSSTLTIYNGATDDSANWTVVATPTNLTGSLAGKTYTVTAMSADVGYVDLVASRGGFANVTSRFTVSKSKAGVAGAAGSAVSVTTSRSTVFTATDGSLDGGQADITLVATVSGIASPTYAWSFDGFQTSPTNSAASSQAITAAQFGTAKSATVTCTVNGSFVDRVTIVRLEKSSAAAGATVGATIGENLGGQITAENVSTFIGSAAIGAAQIGSLALTGSGKFSVKTAVTGQRMEMDSRAIKVIDAGGTVRVQIGDLTV